jgi:hypothetical protein
MNLIGKSEYHLSDCLFDDMISRCLGRFNYQVSHRKFQIEINNRRTTLISLFMDDRNVVNQTEPLRSIVHNQLMILIGKFGSSQEFLRLNDWRRDLLTNPLIIGRCRSVLDAISIIVSLFYDKCFLLLFAHLEKHPFIDTYRFISNEKDPTVSKDLHSMWHQCLMLTLEKIDLAVVQRDLDNISLTFDLHLPCAKMEYKIIRKIREIIAQDVQKDDNGDFNNEKHHHKSNGTMASSKFLRISRSVSID